MDKKVTDAINLLKQQGFKVLRPYKKKESYHNVGDFGDMDKFYFGKVVDCEANGLSDDAKPFEFGCVVFVYDDNGNIYNVEDAFTMFEDIHEPLLNDVKIVTGRRDEDLIGKSFDDDKINQLFSDKNQGIVIAHNAMYDRPKLEKRFPVLENVPWGCSIQDVPWMKCNVIDIKLRLLGIDLCEFHFKGHYAENDCYALLDILNEQLPTRENTVFQELLSNARKQSVRMWAIDSPYTSKDRLKEYGFRWDDNFKAFYIDLQIKISDVIKDPVWKFLEDSVYGYELQKNMVALGKVNALNKYSFRIHPTNGYLRHTLGFGKYKDTMITDVARKDPDYLKWCMKPGSLSFDLRDDVRRTVNYRLQEYGYVV